MGLQLNPDQQAFYEAVDRILWEEWDPIGVNNVPAARNEYCNYLPRVFTLALSSPTPSPIFEFLHLVTTDNMGLGPNPSHNQAIAERIYSLRLEMGL